jgi:hypothetical protein
MKPGTDPYARLYSDQCRLVSRKEALAEDSGLWRAAGPHLAQIGIAMKHQMGNNAEVHRAFYRELRLPILVGVSNGRYKHSAVVVEIQFRCGHR